MAQEFARLSTAAGKDERERCEGLPNFEKAYYRANSKSRIEQQGLLREGSKHQASKIDARIQRRSTVRSVSPPPPPSTQQAMPAPQEANPAATHPPLAPSATAPTIRPLAALPAINDKPLVFEMGSSKDHMKELQDSHVKCFKKGNHGVRNSQYNFIPFIPDEYDTDTKLLPKGEKLIGEKFEWLKKPSRTPRTMEEIQNQDRNDQAMLPLDSTNSI